MGSKAAVAYAQAHDLPSLTITEYNMARVLDEMNVEWWSDRNTPQQNYQNLMDSYAMSFEEPQAVSFNFGSFLSHMPQSRFMPTAIAFIRLAKLTSVI